MSQNWLDRAGFDGQRSYLDMIRKNYNESTQHWLIEYSVHTRLKDIPNEDLQWLTGEVELDFSKLGLSEEEIKAIMLSYVDKGLRIPNTNYKLRYHGLMGFSVIEECEDNIPILPDNWKEMVVAVGNYQRAT